MLTRKQAYVEYLRKDKDAQCPKKKKFAEWNRRKEDGIVEDVNTGFVELDEQNMPTVGEELGFSIIPMVISRGKPFR